MFAYFEVVMGLSFLVLIVVVVRLYRGVRILNARINILSQLVKVTRQERVLGQEAVQEGAREVETEQLLQAEHQLQGSMKGEFDFQGVQGLLSKYEVQGSGLQVEVKNDLSYIGRPGQREEVDSS